DIFSSMTDDEVKKFRASVEPAKSVIHKLRQISFAIINSPTKLLPAWNEILRDLQLPPRMLPRDVRTRWHSTGDMIHLSLKYRAAVDRLTSDK
ncbi:uncharacterized protein BXZ73DRAFT_14875, partial [Epithele typhae]|uniref:uncharacterized protein n=1 Tax=Epithele typhae TaxID=378194 RepID=UPI002007EA70